MPYFDLHTHSAFSSGESSIEQLAVTARQLGYAGICFEDYFQNDSQIKKLRKKIEEVRRKTKIDVFLGFEARNLKELNKLVDRRKKFDILLVRGGNLALNRKAVETSQVDILTHPELDRMDSGLNHILMRLAKKNNVAIEINFREILLSSKKSKSKVLANIKQNVRLAKKYKTPIVLCSGAISHWELRDPQILISLGCQLGLELKEAKNAITKIPENIIRQSEERKDEKWIIPGVKVVR